MKVASKVKVSPHFYNCSFCVYFTSVLSALVEARQRDIGDPETREVALEIYSTTSTKVSSMSIAQLCELLYFGGCYEEGLAYSQLYIDETRNGEEESMCLR